MAKGVYIGVGNKAHKVKKIYIGVGGVAHKVKKAYIGVGGKARLFFSSGELSYYGTATALGRARYQHAAASCSDFAIFSTGSNYSRVDKYDKSLTVTTADLSSYYPGQQAGASAYMRAYSSKGYTYTYYAFFAGGYTGSYWDEVIRLDSSLTRNDFTPLNYAKHWLAGGNAGQWVFFAGGRKSDGYPDVYTEGYNYDGTKMSDLSLSALYDGAYYLCGVSGKNHVLFAGGINDNGPLKTVNAYSHSGPREIPTGLSVARRESAGAAVGDYMLVAGGIDSNPLTTVDAYNSSLTRSNPTGLSAARYALSGVSLGGVALFGGGYPVSGRSDVVDMYDASLTRTTTTPLSVARGYGAGASVGVYGLFAGGHDGSKTSNVVDVYKYD